MVLLFAADFVLYLSLSSLDQSHPHTIRHPTHRSPAAILTAMDVAAVRDEIVERANAMNDRARTGATFTVQELDGIKCSLLNVCPQQEALDCEALTELLQEVAHLSHKDWAVTGANSQRLGSILLPAGLTEGRKQMMERILNEGNWDGAFSHASTRDPSVLQKPWIVLVTGVK
jgi:hypothetical protein